jgi:hypothetical protein
MRLKGRERVAASHGASNDDARSLALELAGMRALQPADPVVLRLVLEQGETAWRRVTGTWLRVRTSGRWSAAVPGDMLVTDRRLLLRLATGEVVSLWWGSVVGFSPDLAAGHVVLDFGDGSPRALSGPGTPVIAVAGVASLYGIAALTTHPSLEVLRRITSSQD